MLISQMQNKQVNDDPAMKRLLSRQHVKAVIVVYFRERSRSRRRGH